MKTVSIPQLLVNNVAYELIIQFDGQRFCFGHNTYAAMAFGVSVEGTLLVRLIDTDEICFIAGDIVSMLDN